MIGFAQALPIIRRTTREHMRRPGLPREKVLATVVQLLEKTLIRVGNDEYARTNRSYGLTTLRDTHVEFKGERVRFTFRGKSGVDHEIDLNDRRLARIVRQCRDLPGYDLFQYYDENGVRQAVGSEEVNAYLKEVTGEDLTSKDFRTWAGTVLAAQLLREFAAVTSTTQAKKNIVAAVEQVAKKLGNTKAVCRRCYIHPAVLHSYLDGTKKKIIGERARKVSRAVDRLTGMESSVLTLLRRRASPGRRRRRVEVSAA
jgi:DNA topoisomerase-1